MDIQGIVWKLEEGSRNVYCCQWKAQQIACDREIGKDNVKENGARGENWGKKNFHGETKAIARSKRARRRVIKRALTRISAKKGVMPIKVEKDRRGIVSQDRMLKRCVVHNTHAELAWGSSSSERTQGEEENIAG